MAARRPSNFRSSFNRWDRREIGLKPENALSRVAQLIEVGEVSDANQALYDIITDNQTRRRQWSKTYEGIMLKLMELSVALRMPGMVKEALHKYRAMCMQSNVSSLEEVVRFLVDLAEKRTEDARKTVDETILEGAEDLEDGAMETPETLILEAAGNALTKERVDRQQVVPWMRFLWEAYRVVLDIVKTHSKLENCYHDMAAKAFAFCVKYKRYMEFRRLCDMLRQHLNQLMNNPRNSPNDVKITDPDTLQKFMETRFTQLSTAVKLEHWQEAYRTIQDIHMIMTLGKAKAKPQHMSIYYDKLMQVFWVSGNYLYHAHALYKLYTLSIKQNRNLSAGDAQNMASRLMLAALSIPVYDAQSAVLSDSYGIMTDVLGTPTNDNATRHARMGSLLGYSSAAERDPLIAELLSKGVGRACHPELHDLHDILEGEMAPLKFSDRFKKVLTFVESQEVLKEYVVPLRRVGIFRLLEQLGRVYDVMRLDDMKRVASFTDYAEVEETALTALKTRSLAVRFDYQNQCLRFESELFSTDGMRSQLGRLARRMALTSKMLTDKSLVSAPSSDKDVIALSLEKEKKAFARRKAAIAKAKADAEEEEKNILRRRDIIERRKEEAERRTAEAVKQKKLAAARELAIAEARRKQEEAKRRYEEQQKMAQMSAESATGAAALARTGVIGAEEVEGEAEREERMTREKEKELKEQAEIKKRVQQLSSHLNHIERATREEQWPLRKDEHKKEAERQSRVTEEIAAKELEEGMMRHARALEDKERTTRIMPSLKVYLTELMARVDSDFHDWAVKERERAAAQAASEAEQAKIREEEQERKRKEQEVEERLAREKAEHAERLEKEREEKELEAARKDEEERQKAAEAAAKATKVYRPGMLQNRLKANAARPTAGATPATAAPVAPTPEPRVSPRPATVSSGRAWEKPSSRLAERLAERSGSGPSLSRESSGLSSGMNSAPSSGATSLKARLAERKLSSTGPDISREPSVSNEEKPKLKASPGAWQPRRLREGGAGSGPGPIKPPGPTKPPGPNPTSNSSSTASGQRPKLFGARKPPSS